MRPLVWRFGMRVVSPGRIIMAEEGTNAIPGPALEIRTVTTHRRASYCHFC